MVRIGRLNLDPRQRRLLDGGKPVRLGSRAFDILCVLAEARGSPVSKDELMARVWPGIFVADNNLTVHISALRKALDQGHGAKARIVTIPGRGYRLILDEDEAPAAEPLIGKPSIVVLPFENMSGDPDQEYFADGIVEEITTAIARLPWLFVIARNSAFTYKGRAVDVRRVARELGVRYVLEGSVRRGGNRVRVTGQLIDTSTGAHIWADRFDRALDDIFELQDEVAASVVGAIEPRLRRSEMERAARKPTGSLDAYDLYLRALARSYTYTQAGAREAIALLRQALDIDPSYAPAAALSGWCLLLLRFQGWGAQSDADAAAGIALARQALDNAHDDPDTLWQAAYTLFLLAGDAAQASALLDRALTLNPNAATAWMARGFVHALRNEPDAAIAALDRARRISPFDPLGYFNGAGLAVANFAAHRFAEAIGWADRVLLNHPRHAPALRTKIAASALDGRLEAARAALGVLSAIDTPLTIAGYRALFAHSTAPELFELYITGLRLAGAPEGGTTVA